MVNSFTDLLRMGLSSLLCDPVTFLAMKSDLIHMCSVLIKVIVLVTIILIIRPSIDNFLVVNHDLFFLQVRSVTAEVRSSITVSNLQQMSILTELAAVS